MSLPIRTTLAEQLVHVGYETARLGLWGRAHRHYERAIEVQTPSQMGDLYLAGLLRAEAGDAAGVRALARLALNAPRGNRYEKEHFIRLMVLAPDVAAAHADLVPEVANSLEFPDWPQGEAWLRGLAHLVIGADAPAAEALAKARSLTVAGPALALAQHRLGQVAAARQTLGRFDREADALMRAAVEGEKVKLPLAYWDRWLHFELLRREAHRAIRGGPPLPSPYDRLYDGRVLALLGKPDEAEAQIEAAVALRPDDPVVWLTRAQVYGRLGREDRMAADVSRALALKSDDPRPWVEAGRFLAGLGEREKADAAFARASQLGQGELNRFLEAGWWVAGPYPEALELACPPERAADPSKPVAAIRQPGDLPWQSVPTNPSSNNIELHLGTGLSARGTYYALAHVHADAARTAVLRFRPREDGRVWVNGRLVFDGLKTWGDGAGTDLRIPVTLEPGRNVLLLKTRQTEGHPWCEVNFTDAPIQRAFDLAALGLWSEADDAFAEAARRVPLGAWYTWHAFVALQCLAADGRDREYRDAYNELIHQHGPSEDPGILRDLANSCLLPPAEGNAERERWITVLRKDVESQPDATWNYHRLAHGLYRAGQFAEAEVSLRRAIELTDQLYFHPLLVSVLHRLGRADEAREELRKIEERHAALVEEALTATPYRPAQYWQEEMWYQTCIREARGLVLGHDPGPSPPEVKLTERARRRLAELDRAEDASARLVLEFPDQPRLWIDRGRRLGELGRWDEATVAFERASELAPSSVQVGKERARARSELGRWDEAAADALRTYALIPEPAPRFPYYPWEAGRGA